MHKRSLNKQVTKIVNDKVVIENAVNYLNISITDC